MAETLRAQKRALARARADACSLCVVAESNELSRSESSACFVLKRSACQLCVCTHLPVPCLRLFLLSEREFACAVPVGRVKKFASSNIAPFRPLSTPPTGFRFSKRTKQTLLSFTGCRIHFQPISVAGDGRYLFYAPIGGRRPLWGRTGAIFVGRTIRACTATSTRFRTYLLSPAKRRLARDLLFSVHVIGDQTTEHGPHGPTSSDAAGVARRERRLRWLLRNEAVV